MRLPLCGALFAAGVLAGGCVFSFENPVASQNAGTVTGTVFYGGAPGQSVAGTQVDMLWSGLSIDLSAAGHFAFLGLPDGTYTLRYTVPPATPGGAPVVGELLDLYLPFTSGNVADTIALGLISISPPGTVEGNVTLADGGAAGGVAVAAFVPSGDGGAGEFEGYSTSTDSTGHYALTLPTGDHAVWVSTATQSAELDVGGLQSAEDRTGQDIAMVEPAFPGASLSGYVVLDPQGAHAPQSVVQPILSDPFGVLLSPACPGCQSALAFGPPAPAQGVTAAHVTVNGLPAGVLYQMTCALPNANQQIPAVVLNGIPAIAGQTTVLRQIFLLSQTTLAANHALALDVISADAGTGSSSSSGGPTTGSSGSGSSSQTGTTNGSSSSSGTSLVGSSSSGSSPGSSSSGSASRSSTTAASSSSSGSSSPGQSSSSGSSLASSSSSSGNSSPSQSSSSSGSSSASSSGSSGSSPTSSSSSNGSSLASSSSSSSNSSPSQSSSSSGSGNSSASSSSSSSPTSSTSSNGSSLASSSSSSSSLASSSSSSSSLASSSSSSGGTSTSASSSQGTSSGTSGGSSGSSSGGSSSAGSPPGAGCKIDTDCASQVCLGDVCCKGTCLTQAPCGATVCSDDNGDCIYPATQCADAGCTDDLLTTAAVCSNGICQPATTTTCAPFACLADACAQQCVPDQGDCAEGAYCDDNGACQPQAAAGQPCGLDTECPSGLCLGNICCAEACLGDDAGPCAATCSANGGACDYPATQCGDGSCDPDSGVEIPAVLCSNGSCPTQTPTSCAPYLCGANACETSCSSDANCAPNFFCDTSSSGLCLSNGSLPAGAACTAGTECSGVGLCLGGFCCTSSCVTIDAGACGASQCEPADAGSPGACGYPPQFPNPGFVLCAGGSCPTGQASQIDPSYCSGGGCPNQTQTSCSGYLCEDGGCGTSPCGTDPNTCASGYFCDFENSRECLAEGSLGPGTSCTTDESCQSGQCLGGSCCASTCSTSDLTCGAIACNSSTETNPGACQYPTNSTPCGSTLFYGCDGGGFCNTSCTTNAQCAPSINCDVPDCLPT